MSKLIKNTKNHEEVKAKKEERKRLKLERVKEIVRGTSGEPTIAEATYVIDLLKAQNWYNVNTENKAITKYAIAYIKHLNLKEYEYSFSQAADYELRQIGIIGRLIMREQYISPKHVAVIKSKMDNLRDKYVKGTEVKPVGDKPLVPVVSIQDKIQESANKHIWDFDDAIDEFIKTKSSSFSAKSYLLSKTISGAVAKRIGDYYNRLAAELGEAILGKDEQLVEGYSYLTKAELKRFKTFVDGIIADCNQQVVTAKSVRAPRVRKAIPPMKLVSKMKYLKELPELKLKSINPVDIVGASELWVYNAKYRKVTVYRGALSVKGTTIIGYEISGTDSKGLRKPEEFFSNLVLKKKELADKFKKLTTKPSAPNGRINEDTILIGAFK